MRNGFPRELVTHLRCVRDGGTLEIATTPHIMGEKGSVWQGLLVCTDCMGTYKIEEGILNTISEIDLDDESQREQNIRNDLALKADPTKTIEDGWKSAFEQMEILPTMEAVRGTGNETLLEMGSGTGRYTHALVEKVKYVLAVDFSLTALRVLKERLNKRDNIGLICGDVTRLKLATGSMDRVVSTLVSNLPTHEHRNAMYRLAAQTLRPDGRLIFSTHNHGFWQKRRKAEKSGRYSEIPIYRYNFKFAECRDEVKPYFNKIKLRPIQIYLPFAHRIGMPLIALSRMLERVPWMRTFGHLILCVAEKPVYQMTKYKQRA